MFITNLYTIKSIESHVAYVWFFLTCISYCTYFEKLTSRTWALLNKRLKYLLFVIDNKNDYHTQVNVILLLVCVSIELSFSYGPFASITQSGLMYECLLANKTVFGVHLRSYKIHHQKLQISRNFFSNRLNVIISVAVNGLTSLFKIMENINSRTICVELTNHWNDYFIIVIFISVAGK